MTVTHTVPSFDLFVWRGHWVLRSRHDSYADFLKARSRVEAGVRAECRKTVRRVVGFKEPDRPTAARAHREAVADAMVIRAQHMKLYKSGTGRLVALPPENLGVANRNTPTTKGENT